jgi:Spy/CpxP family protein refolding chaperone
MALCSIAIAAGILGVAALVKGFVFRRRFGGGPFGYASCGPGFGYGGCGGYRRGWGGGRRGWGRGSGPGGSFWLRALFSRLDTTPGQEREIRAAIEDFTTNARSAKEGLKASREHVARAIAGESFDESALGDASSRVDTAATQVKDAFAGALKRIHAALDPKQRERLSELIANGPGFGRGFRGWGGPYREADL